MCRLLAGPGIRGMGIFFLFPCFLLAATKLAFMPYRIAATENESRFSYWVNLLYSQLRLKGRL